MRLNAKQIAAYTGGQFLVDPIDASALNGKVIVGADANARITFSSTLAGGQSAMALSGNVATDLAMPTFTATANSGGESLR